MFPALCLVLGVQYKCSSHSALSSGNPPLVGRWFMQTQGERLWLDSLFPTGQLLSFDIGDQPVFEIPLSNVSQCTTGKNEVTLEFHQNDDAEVSLMEVRFYVPPTQEDGVDPVEVRLPLVTLGTDWC